MSRSVGRSSHSAFNLVNERKPMNPVAEQVDPQVSNVWETVNSLINGFLALLPNLVIALVVFIIFWLLAKGLRKVIQHVTRNHASANIGIVLGRVAYGGVLLLGLLDVRFISSLPVKRQPVCTAWADTKPAQIVEAEG